MKYTDMNICLKNLCTLANETSQWYRTAENIVVSPHSMIGDDTTWPSGAETLIPTNFGASPC